MADYEFSSEIETSGQHKINHMHVMAWGCKFDDLQTLVENHLQGVSKRETLLDRGNREMELCGTLQDVKYKVTLEYGACPTGDGGEGHNVDVETLAQAEDRLSPILATEMRKYEAEMTAHIREQEEFIKSRHRR